MRTHYCGLIDEALVGQTVTLCGWVNTHSIAGPRGLRRPA